MEVKLHRITFLLVLAIIIVTVKMIVLLLLQVNTLYLQILLPSMPYVEDQTKPNMTTDNHSVPPTDRENHYEEVNFKKLES